MNPHWEVYGFALGQPFNMVVAIVTLLSWLAAREPKRPPADSMLWLMLAFAAWMSFNSLFAPEPDWSWPLWQQTTKTFVFLLFVLMTARTKARIHSLIWVIVISLGYYGAKGGIFTIVSGARYHVFGPENSPIADNNQLALAMVTTLPLIQYLRHVSRNGWIRRGLGVLFALQLVAIVGTYSRGGIIALIVVLLLLWMRAQRKVLYLIAGLAVAVFAMDLLPTAFHERMDTIAVAEHDDSFKGRLTSWQVCYLYAVDHFPLGAGFWGTQRPPIYNHYFPGEETHAAHSIFFQVLGEHGFPGLTLYLLLIVLALKNCRTVVRQTRDRMGLAWSSELARAMQSSIIAFSVGGAALSMAYYEGFLVLLALSSCLRALTAPARKTAAGSDNTATIRSRANRWAISVDHPQTFARH